MGRSLLLLLCLAFFLVGCDLITPTGYVVDDVDELVQMVNDTPSEGYCTNETNLDDSNPCTEDICFEGEIKHVNNARRSEELTFCVADHCDGNDLIDYPQPGYDRCVNGTLVPYDCTPTITYSTDCNSNGSKSGSTGGTSNPPQSSFSGFKTGNDEGNSSIQEQPDVPEFTATAAMIAITISVLGFVLLRKRD